MDCGVFFTSVVSRGTARRLSRAFVMGNTWKTYVTCSCASYIIVDLDLIILQNPWSNVLEWSFKTKLKMRPHVMRNTAGGPNWDFLTFLSRRLRDQACSFDVVDCFLQFAWKKKKKKEKKDIARGDPAFISIWLHGVQIAKSAFLSNSD